MVATALADWARSGEQILQSSLAHPGALTLALVFSGGLLTSLGPCSLSLLPVTLAYLAGFESERQRPWLRSLSFCAGIAGSLVLLGLVAGQEATLQSRRGAVRCRVRRDDGTPDGTVFMPFAYREAAANLLTNAALDPFGKIPEFKYCAVQVRIPQAA